ncbi:hypothetical protein LC085_07655 [Bacillus tianshenii]|uniref:hypothetical protein n=1 Tax=Sutcliffiella tianshenii TaxID=1463404 RepID=UPI001CD4781F|nr:hypothetical protein [Bacillus tianshenii]MCA1319787.1 hypothetical protein [Bacillus tianshenii]
MSLKELVKSNPNDAIDKIKQRVRYVDYRDDQNRVDILDYIAAKVKGQISPHLRLARRARRGFYPKWVEFQRLLRYFNMQEILTRENNYSPIPEHVLNHWDSLSVVQLEHLIELFGYIHRDEDEAFSRIFEMCFEEWARPALLEAFERVDITKSDKEIVTYVCKVFFTNFIANRAESQGIRRKRRNGEWVYYAMKYVSDENFMHEDVLQTIFHTDQINLPILREIDTKVTRQQIRFLIKLYEYVREDVKVMSTEQFYEKYPHKKMNYKEISKELGITYESFIKNIQRIKAKIL